MLTKKSKSLLDANSIIENASLIIQGIIGRPLAKNEYDLLSKLTGDEGEVYSPMQPLHELKNEHTIALEGIYFLYFHDSKTGFISENVNQSIFIKVLDFYSQSISANLAQNTEIICYFLDFLRAQKR